MEPKAKNEPKGWIIQAEMLTPDQHCYLCPSPHTKRPIENPVDSWWNADIKLAWVYDVKADADAECKKHKQNAKVIPVPDAEA